MSAKRLASFALVLVLVAGPAPATLAMGPEVVPGGLQSWFGEFFGWLASIFTLEKMGPILIPTGVQESEPGTVESSAKTLEPPTTECGPEVVPLG